MNERRRAFRWQINQQAKVKLEGAEAFADCQIKNVNLRGLQVSFRLTLPKDAFLKLSLVLAEGLTLDIEAWVVWHKTTAQLNTYGLYFSKVRDSDKEKIYKFVQRDYPEQIKRRYWQGLKGEGGETMRGPSFEDKRIFARFSTKFPVKFLDLNANREGEVQTQDISAKGLGLVSNAELPPRTPLELWLEIPDQGEPLYARGNVVWSKMVGPGEYRSGVNLEKADLLGLSRVLRTI